MAGDNCSARPYTEKYGTSVSRGVGPGVAWVHYYKGWLFTDVDEREFTEETGYEEDGDARRGQMWEAMLPWLARQCGFDDSTSPWRENVEA